MSDTERPHVPIRRAVPVKGPGISEELQADTDKPEEEAEANPKTASRLPENSEEFFRRAKATIGRKEVVPAAEARPHQERPAVASSLTPDRRSLSVNLDTVMDILDCAQARDREVLKDIIQRLGQLTPTARMRVLKAINGIFQ